MATDPRKRQKKLERRNAKRKEHKHHLIRAQSGGLVEKLTAAANCPPLHCWVPDVLWREGLGSVLLSRLLPNGSVAVAVFLVDRYCLGVKNAMSAVISRSEYDSKFVRGLRIQYPARDVPLAYARKLVEDAVEYAEVLGFHPHADYHDAIVLFGDVDPGECAEEFEFGKAGRPYFFAGPHDTPERCRQILATLTKHCGIGGFDYTIPFGDPNTFLPKSIRPGHPRLAVSPEDGDELDGMDEFDDDD